MTPSLSSVYGFRATAPVTPAAVIAFCCLCTQRIAAPHIGCCCVTHEGCSIILLDCKCITVYISCLLSLTDSSYAGDYSVRDNDTTWLQVAVNE